MNRLIRWGLAAGLAAALAVFGNAQAQGTGSSATGSSGSRGDTGGPTPGGADRTTGGSTDAQGGARGSSSDPGTRGSATSGSQDATGGSAASGSATGSSAAGSSAGDTGSASGRQAAASGSAQKVDKDLQERLEKIHAAHQTELHLAKIATQNAQSPEVKQFAEQMQTDHEKADQKLTQWAQGAGVNLEGKTFQKENERAMKDAEKLQSKTGAEFDREYMSRMVKEHEKAHKEVGKAAKDAKKANHTELASMLEQGGTGIQGHLQHAKQLEKSAGKAGETRQGRRPATGTGSGASDRPSSGSRGDTGGPTPGGADRTTGTPTGSTPQGGAPGSSSDSGERKAQ
jgi:putative membrane protein